MSNTLLRIYPSELKMPFELKKSNSGCIELVNKTDERVAFKLRCRHQGDPQDYQCKDKFLIQSVVVQEGITHKDIVPEMFGRAPGRVVEEFKLRVVYIPANPPSPVPEGDEEEIADMEVDHEVFRQSMIDAAEYASGPQASHDEDASTVKSEVVKYVAENKKLQQELERLSERRQSLRGFSQTFVLFVFMLSVLVGYWMTGRRV
ncbi:hypothetical protein ZWY2020_021456 [Hordeum vulgare]|nr:hypothetical protein ZWY2020_021456 [Hordeum vulgare]